MIVFIEVVAILILITAILFLCIFAWSEDRVAFKHEEQMKQVVIWLAILTSLYTLFYAANSMSQHNFWVLVGLIFLIVTMFKLALQKKEAVEKTSEQLAQEEQKEIEFQNKVSKLIQQSRQKQQKQQRETEKSQSKLPQS
jgi:signal transduction histidine kinase